MTETTTAPTTHDESPTLGALAAALAKAQTAMKSASKDSLNPHFGSKYADLASIWDACRGPLGANGLAVLQRVRSDARSVTVTTMLVHSSGEYVRDALTLPVAQPTPQGFGSAITYGRRYGLAALVGVASDVDDDGNAASGHSMPSSAGRKNAPSATAALKAKMREKVGAPVVEASAEPPPPSDEDAPRDAQAETSAPAAAPVATIPFGKRKGEPVTALDARALNWYADAARKELADASKARFHAATTLWLAALEAELRRR